MPTYTELKKAIFYSHEKPELLANILKDVLDITPEIYAQEPTFALTTPSPSEANKITGGGEDRVVEVTVENGTSSVLITATNKDGQTFNKEGTNQDKVTVGGSGEALTVTVDTTEISTSGGTYNFTIKVKETDTLDIAYSFIVTVTKAE